jgi:deazaflavin-dependent oxidoreductase (nitroreductase family)
MQSSTALPYVDPGHPHGGIYRAYSTFLGTGLGRWTAINVASHIDPWFMRLTKGRIGMGLMLPSALLETRGARSGETRRNAVLYFHDGDAPIIIASAHGRPKHPSWYHNLKAHPEVRLAGLPFRAQLVEDQQERERIWRLADKVYPPFVDYRNRAGRRIPIVRLTEVATS